ncbi:MAG: hypothetical protein EOO14_03075 [Chitinophagaceae bacterium]|nr:MAG: hypothetical protein EOO14_03075 [Chitinophagaceae bacterium]
MRKIFPFEISMAVKDRSRRFQFVTLSMFLFCLTVILVGIIVRVVEPVYENSVRNQPVSAPYADISSPLTPYSVQK